MSLLADYHKEQGLKRIIESESGFCTYWKIGRECFIGDVYVIPNKRKSGILKQWVSEITLEAKSWGCKYVSCSTVPQANNSQISQNVILALGFKFFREEPGAKYFIKEIH